MDPFGENRLTMESAGASADSRDAWFDIVADDPFFAPANQKVLKKSIRQLESGEGKARPLAKA